MNYIEMKSADNYRVIVLQFNEWDSLVLVCRVACVDVNSSNHDVYHLSGRNSNVLLELLCNKMTRKDIIELFFT